jgi:signal transduction histidine kinase
LLKTIVRRRTPAITTSANSIGTSCQSLSQVDVSGPFRTNVTHDGKGFDAGRLATSGGLGLIMMRERASQLNGTFEFESAPNRGTTIGVVVPFR